MQRTSWKPLTCALPFMTACCSKSECLVALAASGKHAAHAALSLAVRDGATVCQTMSLRCWNELRGR